MPDLVFEPNAIDYCPANALVLANASKLAYCTNKGEVRRAVEPWGFARFRLISEGSTQLFVTANDKTMIVAFRGTEMNLEDWLSDGKVKLMGGPLGPIHEGFGVALAAIWDEVLAAIKDFYVQGQGLWFTGHSLGAALATLATAKFLAQPNQISGVKTDLRGLYTFGSPRVGNSEFTKKFDTLFPKRAFRFVNNRDIVTRVAPRTVLGYDHVGVALYIDQDGVLHTDPSAWQMFLEAVKAATPFILQIQGKRLATITDHAIDGYIQRIKNEFEKLANQRG